MDRIDELELECYKAALGKVVTRAITANFANGSLAHREDEQMRQIDPRYIMDTAIEYGIDPHELNRWYMDRQRPAQEPPHA